jgi:hypothetical protein
MVHNDKISQFPLLPWHDQICAIKYVQAKGELEGYQSIPTAEKLAVPSVSQPWQPVPHGMF